MKIKHTLTAISLLFTIGNIHAQKLEDTEIISTQVVSPDCGDEISTDAFPTIYNSFADKNGVVNIELGDGNVDKPECFEPQAVEAVGKAPRYIFGIGFRVASWEFNTRVKKIIFKTKFYLPQTECTQLSSNGEECYKSQVVGGEPLSRVVTVEVDLAKAVTPGLNEYFDYYFEIAQPLHHQVHDLKINYANIMRGTRKNYVIQESEKYTDRRLSYDREDIKPIIDGTVLSPGILKIEVKK